MSTWRESFSAEEGLRRWRRLKTLIILAVLLLVAVLYLSYRYSPSRPVTYSNIVDHYKYGSIGSDVENGLPLAVMKVLPRMFPEYLPPGRPRDYTAFGFIQEPDHAMPVGFSTRRRYVDLIAQNCASCHTGTVRETKEGPPRIYLTMPANTLDLQAFLFFLFNCAGDSRFTPDRVLEEIEKDGRLFILDRYVYRWAIQAMKDRLMQRHKEVAILFTPDHPRFGPGRADTFNSYKTNQFVEYYKNGLSPEENIGTVDFPSVWNQRPREGMHLHWDGNNTSVRERNLGAALGAGATRENIDLPKIGRVEDWLDGRAPPEFPFKDKIDANKVERGRALYQQYCFRCHDFKGAEVGQVVPLDRIGTDEHRLNSFTPAFVKLQTDYSKGYDWEFTHFQKTDGYANMPLDGIGARAPYLHNGSVPTLWDLLTPAAARPDHFYRGHDVYDREKVGFLTDVDEVDGRESFLLDTKLRGNSNRGHTGEPYGTELGDEDKWSLVEFLKTL